MTLRAAAKPGMVPHPTVARAEALLADALPRRQRPLRGRMLSRFRRNHGRWPDPGRLRSSLADYLYFRRLGPDLSDPLIRETTDKAHAKDYVARLVGDIAVPTLALLSLPEEVSDAVFPADCAIKPTHASGEYILRAGDAPLDLDRIRRWFDLDYHALSGEHQYRGLRPQVIVEPLVFGNAAPTDYKILCREGRARLIDVFTDRKTGLRRTVFDRDWRRHPIRCNFPASEREIARPPALDRMIAIAEALAAPFELVRIDLYSEGDAVLVGEITHCPHGGALRFGSAEEEARYDALIFGP
ncbi:MAG: ATP-grasp fold amidoligase family protein [Rubricella sp.]